MSFVYADFSGIDGMRRFQEIAVNFNFTHPNLGIVTFPQDFTSAYVSSLDEAEENDEFEFFVIPWPTRPQVGWFNGLFAPSHIESVNRILAESCYAEPNSIILPPKHYAVGTCYDEHSEVYLMTKLDLGSADHGSIHAWRKAHDELGTGDNKVAPVFLSENLGAFLSGLTLEENAKKQISENHQKRSKMDHG